MCAEVSEMSGQLWSYSWLKAVSLHWGEWSLLDFSAGKEDKRRSCESWPLLDSQISIAVRKFGIWLKTEGHRVSVSKDSCKGRFSCTMQLCPWQAAVVLSKRVQKDTDTDKKSREVVEVFSLLSHSLAPATCPEKIWTSLPAKPGTEVKTREGDEQMTDWYLKEDIKRLLAVTKWTAMNCRIRRPERMPAQIIFFGGCSHLINTRWGELKQCFQLLLCAGQIWSWWNEQRFP